MVGKKHRGEIQFIGGRGGGQFPQHKNILSATLPYHWPAIARQQPIFSLNLSDVRSETCALDCDFYFRHSGALANAHGNIDRYSRSAPQEKKDTINEVKHCL